MKPNFIIISVISIISTILFIFFFGFKRNNKDKTISDYNFPMVDSLPDNLMMPDPFKKLDGARVSKVSQWPEHRNFLKALLQHYLYGNIPPKPTDEELSFIQLSDEIYTPPNSSIIGRKQKYSITITRNSQGHSFSFTLWRPEKLKRYPTLINNHPRPQSTQPTYSMEEGVRRGYMVVVFDRTEVVPDNPVNVNRQEGIFILYPEYDFFTIAAWAWAYQPVIDVLDKLDVIDMNKIVVTGHSRGGQAAMAGGIFDDRITVVAPSTGGPWSVGSHRQRDPEGYRGTTDYPELIKKHHIHWYHPRYFEFIKNQNKLPFDAPTMIALIAPRPLLNLNAIGDGINNGLAHEVGIRAGIMIYEWFGEGNWCRIYWRDLINKYGQEGHDQGPEEYNAIYDFADEYFFRKKGQSRYNVAPNSNNWWYDPSKYPLLIDWSIP